MLANFFYASCIVSRYIIYHSVLWLIFYCPWSWDIFLLRLYPYGLLGLAWAINALPVLTASGFSWASAADMLEMLVFSLLPFARLALDTLQGVCLS